MPYIGYEPAKKPLTSADITDGVITSASISDGTIVNADINSSASIAKTKLNLTGTIGISDLSATGTASSTTFLRGDNTWGSAGASAGQVIQVVTATDSTARSTTSSSYVTASNTLSLSITPSSTSNKILILVNVSVGMDSGYYMYLTIFKNGTNIVGANGLGYLNGDSGSPTMQVPASICYYDSPSSTSSITYDLRVKGNGIQQGYINRGSAQGTIIAMEIKG